MNLKAMLQVAEQSATERGYNIGNVTINAKPIQGTKVGYSCGARKGKTVTGTITIDSRFVEYGEQYEQELLGTVKHELAHLIAETINTRRKHVWHGEAWKAIDLALGDSGQRYYSGEFVKPENKGKTFKSLDDLRKTKPTQPATDWERGTFRQWLERGYHVMKGQHGTPVVWEFDANEYETAKDGKTSTWGRAYAVYFTPDQVEATT